MGRTSLKSNDPIPLPHDGPLHAGLVASQQQQQQQQGQQQPNWQENHTHENNVVFQTALKCLQPTLVGSSDPQEDIRHNEGASSRIVQLIRTLQTAKHIKDQLQALQIYRGNVVQEQKQQQQQQEETKSETEGEKENSSPHLSSSSLWRAVLYRMLLEWFLSHETPLPLRRAIQANLEFMEVQEQEAMQLQTIGEEKEKASISSIAEQRAQVVQSIYCSAYQDYDDEKLQGTASCWQQPLHSLYEALNCYNSTKKDILLDPSQIQHVLVYLKHHAKNDLEPILASLVQGEASEEPFEVEPLSTTTTADMTSTQTTTNTTRASTSFVFVEQSVTDAIQRSIQLAAILKTILAEAPSLAITAVTSQATTETTPSSGSHDNTYHHPQQLPFFQDFLWSLISCRHTPTDALSKLGMTYSRVLLLQKPPLYYWPESIGAEGSVDTANVMDDDGQSSESSHSYTRISTQLSQLADPNHRYSSGSNNKSSTNQLIIIAIVQGLAATVPTPVMLQDSRYFLQYFQQQSNEPDPEVRLAALKGILALISRCLTRLLALKDNNNGDNDDNAHTSNDATPLTALEFRAVQEMAQISLEIVLQAWENPPNRRLGNSIPSLFQKIVAVMEELCKHQTSQPTITNGTQEVPFQDLVTRLLEQPSSRKGRYKALETLLPIVGSRQIMELGKGMNLIESLLEGIGERNSHSSGTIADLWQKILSDLLQDMLSSQKNGETTITNIKSEASLIGKKRKKKQPGNEVAPEQVLLVLPSWWDVWVPSLAKALLASSPSRRRHVAAFCIPRIVPMLGGRKMKAAASATFACLLKAINQPESDELGETGGVLADYSNQLGGIRDCSCWATLEVT